MSTGITIEAKVAIPPTGLRLNQLKRRYSLRLISAPVCHPLRQRCPDDYPPIMKQAETKMKIVIPGIYRQVTNTITSDLIKS
jgi:hypothetical protein